MSRSTTLFRTIAICLLMACMTIFMLGCGEKQPADAKTYDLQQVYQDLMNAQPADAEDLSGVMFETTDKDAINGTYHGLADIELKQEVCYQHAVTGFCEVMLVETASADDVQKVIDIFNARIDTAADDSFYPETAQIWAQNAQVQSEGNYVALVALPDGYTVPDKIFG